MSFIFSEKYGENEFIKVEYTVVAGARYRIRGMYSCEDERGCIDSPELFQTKDEAVSWCEFMTKNKVLPSSLNYVLSDEFYIHKIPQISF